MKKYNIFPGQKPENNQLIYWINSQMKEVLGFYCGGTIFIEADGTRRGYYAKYWRPSNEEDKLLASWSPDGSHVPEKRKYIKKNPKT